MSQVEVWSNGPDLFVRLPGSTGHTIQLPADTIGARTLLRILRERETERKPTVGTFAAPTQSMANEWLRHMKIKSAVDRATELNEEKMEAHAFLDDLGL